MLTAFAVVLSVGVTVTAGYRDGPLLQRGGDPSRGILVNHTPDSRPFDPPDPNRPTVVFVHGFNPLPRVVHFVMAERVSESIARRGDTAFNVMGWDWNAATFTSLNHRENSEATIHQGHLLAMSLLQAGVDPLRTHLIGHSSGGLVVTSAARVFAQQMGRPVAQLTLLEPATCDHSTIFERLQAGSLCPIVENYWSPGPSAYGKEVPLPGIRNYKVNGPASYAGVICPLRSDHLFVVRWYLSTIEQPWGICGFNTSVLLR